MIRALSSDGTVILGVERENIERLQAGNPIFVEGKSLGIEHDIYIYYGETMADLKKQIGLEAIQ